MRRTNHLFDKICDLRNLREAYLRAVSGKRFSKVAREFAENLDENLNRLSVDLQTGTTRFGQFHQFVIHDPKMRIITAPSFTERVLHHAVMNVCEPVFERSMITDTFACRRGKGRLKALARASKFTRRSPAYLKLDIRKYFDSISHEILLARIRRLFREPQMIELFSRIVGSFRGGLGRGLPIGALTSQHLANGYLTPFDRFVKETLRLKCYVRYMDDMVLWGGSPMELRTIADRCQDFLKTQLQLDLKVAPQINWTRHGLDFLGCRLFPTHMVLNRRSKLRFQRKIRWLELQRELGIISESEIQQRAEAIVAFTKAGGVKSWQWRNRVLQQCSVDDRKARTG